MNSNKQKRKLLKAKRRQRAEKIRLKISEQLVYGRLKADHVKLTHINSYGGLPDYYDEIEFRCRDCGIYEIWTASQQKFYFEECKGHTSAIAVNCKSCRNKRKQAIKAQQEYMLEMKNKPVHPNALFFRDLDKFKSLIKTKSI